MILIPIIISILSGLLFIALIAGVIYLIVQRRTPEQNGGPVKHIKFSEVASNFFSLALLITNVTSIITITFTCIEEYFKDDLNNSYYDYNGGNSDLHSAISLLVITIPASIVLTRWMRKQEAGESVEKFTINTTLIATALTIAGSVFSIIYSYLQGSLDIQFFYKVLSVFVIALSVFSYYKYIYKSEDQNYKNAALALAVIAAITISIVTLNKTGTPGQIRKEKFDERRLNDLSLIQNNVLNYWQSHRQLPSKLVDISDPMYQTTIPRDPKTSDPYDYEIVEQSEIINNRPTEASFKLCANFETKRKYSDKFETNQATKSNSIMMGEFDRYYPGNNSPFWDHEIGEKCFVRKLDPNVHFPQNTIPVPTIMN